jgi:hypothetical protein
MSWYHRLQDLGYPFGTFPLSKGLWQSAGETSGKVQRVAGSRKGVFSVSNLVPCACHTPKVVPCSYQGGPLVPLVARNLSASCTGTCALFVVTGTTRLSPIRYR